MNNIIDFFKTYYQFVALTKNCYLIDIDLNIENTEKKIIEDLKVGLTPFIKIENGFLNIQVSYNIRNTLKNKNNLFYIDKSNLNKKYKDLKNSFIPVKNNKNKDKLIIALNNLYIELENEEKKVAFLYPLEFIEIDELNSVILSNEFKNIESTYIPIDSEIIQNEIIFKKFFKYKCKTTPLTLSQMINVELSEIDFYSLNAFLDKRKYELLKELPKTNYKISIINKPIIYTYQINMMVNLDNIFPLSKTTEVFLETILSKKRQYYCYSDNFKPYYGSNTPEYSLAKGQGEVLQNYTKGEIIIPVIGAPGTGKTTLFKSIIANTITNRALDIIYKNKDYNNSMLITSTSKKAIENIAEDIEQENPFMGILYILSSSDKKENSKKANLIKNLQTKIKEIDYKHNIDLKYQNETLFDGYIKYISNKYENIDIKKTIKTIKTDIDNQLKLFNEIQENKTLLSDLNNINNQIKILEKKIIPIKEKSLSINKNFNKSFTSLESNKVFFLETITKPINDYYQTLEQIKNSNFIMRFFHKIVNSKQKIKFTLKRGLNIEHLLDIEFNALLKDILEIREIYRDNSIFENEKKLNNLIFTKNKIEIIISKLDKYNLIIEDFDTSIEDFFRLKLYKQNYELYKLSEVFIIQYILDKYENIKILHYLENASDIIENKYEEKFDRKEALEIISAFFPVVASTIKKMNILCSINKIENLFFATLIDESGMILNGDILYPINLSKKAVIVGDPKQLTAIPDLEEFLQKDFITSLNKKEKEINELFKPYKYSAYDVSAGVNLVENNDIVNAYILDEHRRCQKEIAELFIDIAEYKNLNIHTPIKKPNYLLTDKHLEFFTCSITEKSAKQNTNELEIECIEYILNELEKKGVNLKTQVGIITPYKNQEELLKNKFQEKLNHSEKGRKSIGTIHKFQGVEFEIIIFSSVVNLYSNSTKFVTNNLNLLNVSISRAKFLYIHIGDYYTLKDSNTKIMNRYLKHFKDIHNYKKILLEKDFSKLSLYDKTKFLKNKPYQEKQLFSIKNILDEVCSLISNAQESILIVLPWIREKGLNYLAENADLTKIINKQVKINFRVLYQLKEKEIRELEDMYEPINKIFNLNLTKEEWKKNFISHGTHEKILIVDRKHFLHTSLNFLSTGFFNNPNRFNLRDEIGVVMGAYYVWNYLYNREKSINVDSERIDKELEKFKSLNKSL